jgi:hypothetical protein
LAGAGGFEPPNGGIKNRSATLISLPFSPDRIEKRSCWINTLPVISRLSNKSITHSYHIAASPAETHKANHPDSDFKPPQTVIFACSLLSARRLSSGINLVLRYSDLVASNSISVSRASISGLLPPSGALFCRPSELVTVSIRPDIE